MKGKTQILFRRKLFKLSKYSLAVNIPAELRETLGFKRGSPVAVFLNGDGIQIEKIGDKQHA